MGDHVIDDSNLKLHELSFISCKSSIIALNKTTIFIFQRYIYIIIPFIFIEKEMKSKRRGERISKFIDSTHNSRGESTGNKFSCERISFYYIH
jgi:hypothetical protein